jgi:5'-methylthioadenosine phosphorylase
LQNVQLAIIGGTGLGEKLGSRPGVEKLHVDTPFGPPSGPIFVGDWHGLRVAFLNRHGEGHVHPPSAVPYRANIFALKQLGVSHVLASGAVGSLRDAIAPGHLVVCDQTIDKTHKRTSTFFDDGIAVHVELAEPFCPVLRGVLLACADEVDTTVHTQGTYVVMEGPQFSTRAESHMHRHWGGDVIGMTCMPEAKLAREAEMAYALVALSTDYDCWREPEHVADKQALLAEIIGNLQRATEHATRLIDAAIRRLASGPLPESPAHRALELAIWSHKNQVGSNLVQRLAPLVGRYFANAGR